MGEMRGASALVDRPDLAGGAYQRLSAVEIAVRYAGLLCLAGLPAPSIGTPQWASERGGCQYLRRLLKRCGGAVPTRADLARTLGVWTKTVDGWLNGNVRPKSYFLDEIREVTVPFTFPTRARSSCKATNALWPNITARQAEEWSMSHRPARARKRSENTGSTD